MRLEKDEVVVTFVKGVGLVALEHCGFETICLEYCECGIH